MVKTGRYRISGSFREFVEDSFRELPLREAPITNEVALAGSEISLGYRDPADHLIAATALVYDLVLMTMDRRLANMRAVKTFKR